MTTPAPAAAKTYDLSFARWVRDNVNGGDKLNLCMQCGVCSGSCPIGVQMDYGPRKLFMMIRAGMKEEVLSSNTQFNCTACYRCVVRCPRTVPVTYIMQDLAAKSIEFGYAKGPHENKNFAKSFWWTASILGRTDERLVTMRYFFSLGMSEGVKRLMANLKSAFRLVKAGRMPITAPHRIKDRKSLQAILAKAAEIEKRA